MDFASFLPTCLLDAGNLSFVCQFTEADPADPIFSQIGVRATADPAAAVCLGGKSGLFLLFYFQ
jgi:hypothetical protein